MLELDLEVADLFLRKVVAVVSVLLVGRRLVALDGDGHQIVLHLWTYLFHLQTDETGVVYEGVFFEGRLAERDVNALSVAFEEEAVFRLVSLFAHLDFYLEGLADDAFPDFKRFQFASEKMFFEASDEHFIKESYAIEALHKLILQMLSLLDSSQVHPNILMQFLFEQSSRSSHQS